MKREEYDDYVNRFNKRDLTVFDEYLSPDVKVWNGEFFYTGIDGMKNHYAVIWKSFIETLNILRFVSDEKTAAAELLTTFEPTADADSTPVGPVRIGDRLEFHGVVLYEIADGRFTSIKVSYLTFTHIAPDGIRTPRTV
ncbi:MAG: nuclear transport factor 2 family protein [Sphingobium sp.]|nr:nuclear transport factor 2 family protein [Sphingobium sp.]